MFGCGEEKEVQKSYDFSKANVKVKEWRVGRSIYARNPSV